MLKKKKKGKKGGIYMLILGIKTTWFWALWQKGKT
jgi:hypothetical protein